MVSRGQTTGHRCLLFFSQLITVGLMLQLLSSTVTTSLACTLERVSAVEENAFFIAVCLVCTVLVLWNCTPHPKGICWARRPFHLPMENTATSDHFLPMSVPILLLPRGCCTFSADCVCSASGSEVRSVLLNEAHLPRCGSAPSWPGFKEKHSPTVPP